MKKLLVLVVIALLGVQGCTKQEQASAPAKYTVGLVFDVGGRGDKSFNDAAYRGLEKAKKELDINFEYIEPGQGADREAALRQLASRKDISIIFGIGFIFTDDITNIAKEFPDKQFACIDYTITPDTKLPPNLVALEFKEEEGSYLVGALAGLMSKTHKLGFVGGMQSPLIKKFEVAYVAGVKYVSPKTDVLIGYAGTTGEAFKNPSKGKELALGQYEQGADIIYHASGVTGLGVFEAAREKKKLAIGVDSDQYHEAPGFVLTSMTKVVDVAIFDMIKAAKEGKLPGGTVQTFGLKTKGVDYVYDENNKALIPDSVHARVESIRADIINGTITVPYR
ncbi:MAG TPA: BMP family ABC transporter substrate-binding protein [Bacteroidota bacterium]|nr:BMP family ABC transporter substrate-binding protein [Bacteroidota bacterium]